MEGLNITKETAGNAVFERLFAKVTDAIRDGETISKPLGRVFEVRAITRSLTFGGASGRRWRSRLVIPFLGDAKFWGLYGIFAACVIASLFYLLKMNDRVVDYLVENMIDVGEETGELDTMLYKIADVYDEEVTTLTDGLMKLIEPLLIVFLGGCGRFYRDRLVHAVDRAHSRFEWR